MDEREETLTHSASAAETYQLQTFASAALLPLKVCSAHNENDGELYIILCTEAVSLL